MSDAPVDQAPAPEAAGWRQTKNGKDYVPRPGGEGGIIYRRGEETVEQALDRDARQPKKKSPKASGGKARKPIAPTEIDLRQLERAIEEMLATPGALLAMRGDVWGAQHFERQAPVLARNLVVCAEHNPALRAKLVALMVGEGPLVNVLLYGHLAAAALAYLIPPIVHYLNPPVFPAAKAIVRERFHIPDPDLIPGAYAPPPFEDNGAIAETPPRPAASPESAEAPFTA